MNFSALNTHAIGVQQLVTASAVVHQGAGSLNAVAGVSATAILYSYTSATAINSVAFTTTQFVICNAKATATMGCDAAANTEGYRVQFSNADIVSNASFTASAIVKHQAAVYVAATGSVVSIGSQVAYTTASLQAVADFSANSNRAIWASTGSNQPGTQLFVVTASGGNYYINGVVNATISVKDTHTYVFDISSTTLSTHPFSLSTVSDGTHNGGQAYTANDLQAANIVVSGYAGQANATITLASPILPPTLYYYCPNHSGMGGILNVTEGNVGKALIGGSSGITTLGECNVVAPAEVIVVPYIIAAASAHIHGNAVHISVGNRIAAVTADYTIANAEIVAAASTISASVVSILANAEMSVLPSIIHSSQGSIQASASITSAPITNIGVNASIAASCDITSTAAVTSYTSAHIHGNAVHISVGHRIAAVTPSTVTSNASLTATGVTGAAIYAIADISDTGYWTAAVYHPEVVTPGYWIPAVTQWQYQSSLEQGRTGPNGPSSGSYVSGHWWTDNNGNNLSGETTDTWRLSLPYFGYIPPSAGGPLYRYSIDKNVVITAAIWVPPVVTQAAYTTPAFWTDTGFGPDAEITTAVAEIISIGSGAAIGSADITPLPYISVPTSAIIIASAEVVETSVIQGKIWATAAALASAVLSGSGLRHVYTQGAFSGSNVTISTGTNTVLVSAVISTSAEVTAAADRIIDAQASIEASASIGSVYAENFAVFAVNSTIEGSAEVVGNPFRIVSAEGTFLSSTLIVSTGANNKFTIANIIANAGVSALPNILGITQADIFASAEVGVAKYAEVYVSADIAADASLTADATEYGIPFGTAEIAASSSLVAVAALLVGVEASITNDAVVTAHGGLVVRATADVSDTGYWTAAVNHPAVITPGYWVPAVWGWVSTSNLIVYVNGSWSSGWITHPYRQAGLHSTSQQGGNTHTYYYQEQYVETAATYYVDPVTVSEAYTTPAFWTNTGYAPSANVTATAEVLYGALFDAIASVSSAAHIEVYYVGDVAANSTLDASGINTAHAEGAFTGSNVSISTGQILIFASAVIEASATITAEADRSVIAKAFIEINVEFTSQGIGLNISEGRFSASATIDSDPVVFRFVAVPINIDATVLIRSRFALIAQDGQRSNGILILVPAEDRALSVVFKDRTVYAKAA